MKIAFDYQAFMQKYGGVSRYYVELIRELIRLDQDVLVSSGVYCNSYLNSLPNNVIKGFRLSKYPAKTGRFFHELNYHYSNYQISKSNPKVIHETYYSNKGASKKNQSFKVVTAYDTIHEIFTDQFGQNSKTTCYKKEAFKRADHIISISQSTKNDLVDFFNINPDKVSVVHLASSILDKNHPTASIIKAQKPFLLYVGSRVGYKNFIVMLKAISNSVNLRNDFDIVTFGGGSFNSSEKRTIQSLGFREGQVRHVNGSDVILTSLYKSATALIHPSLYEGFGLTPLEAMNCHCPVISSNTSSMPEVIGNAGGYFNPSDVDSIQSTIESIVYSTECMNKLIQKGIKQAKLFSWEKCAKTTLEIYKKGVL
jgi:glycosyltransferase involved in cell wall biosynthesis